MMNDGDVDKLKALIVFLFIAIAVISGTLIYNNYLDNSTKSNPLVGDWYAMTSEKYSFKGAYTEGEYEEGATELFDIISVDDCFFVGVFDGVKITGTIMDDKIEFITPYYGYNTYVFAERINDNTMQLVEVRYIYVGDTVGTASSYYVLCKDPKSFDKSVVPISDTKMAVETWDVVSEESMVIREDAVHVTATHQDVTEAPGHLFKLNIDFEVGGNSFVGGYYVEASTGILKGIMINSVDQIFEVSIENDTCLVYGAISEWSDDGIATCAGVMAFVRGGASAHVYHPNINLEGLTYKMTDNSIVLQDGSKKNIPGALTLNVTKTVDDGTLCLMKTLPTDIVDIVYTTYLVSDEGGNILYGKCSGVANSKLSGTIGDHHLYVYFSGGENGIDKITMYGYVIKPSSTNELLLYTEMMTFELVQ